eukprot:COSAG02_NODE_3409_length_6790_cov_149.811239_4_plen_122_part_00
MSAEWAAERAVPQAGSEFNPQQIQNTPIFRSNLQENAAPRDGSEGITVFISESSLPQTIPTQPVRSRWDGGTVGGFANAFLDPGAPAVQCSLMLPAVTSTMEMVEPSPSASTLQVAGQLGS